MQEKVINGRTVKYQIGKRDIGIMTFYASFDEENLPFLFENLKDATVYALRIEDWNKELSPWHAPAIYGDEDFGDGAKDTLSFIIEHLIPEMDCARYVIGGYSLAGLFSLWACYQSDVFEVCAASSPSVWFPGWDSFITGNEFKGKYVYLSLGKKENNTKNHIMSTVKDRIQMQYDILKGQLGEEICVLEWNEGGHFTNVKERLMKSLTFILQLIENTILTKIHSNESIKC